MKNKQQGSALIIVLWFIAVIGIVVTFLFFRTEAEWASVVRFEKQRGYAQTAEAVLHKYLGLLVQDETAYDSPKDPWYAGGRVDLEQDGYQITMTIEDEGSKPNLNTISESGLQQIIEFWAARNLQPSTTDSKDMSVTAVPTDAASTSNLPISPDPLLDWRDSDSETRNEGAELSFYQALNPSYEPRNGCFSSLAELKQLKDGAQLYSVFASDVTVYGKVNPNTISGETFINLLNSSGDFQKGWLDTVKDQFASYRTANKHFDKINDFLQLPAITIGTLDKIKPLFQFSGNCNMNMATECNLAVILREAGYKDSVVRAILNRRRAYPFELVSNAYTLLGYKKAKGQVYPDDYLTVISKRIHYRIWMRSSKGASSFYLDTIWERQKAGVKKEWQVVPIYYQELYGKEVPEIPQAEGNTKNNDPDSEDDQNS